MRYKNGVYVVQERRQCSFNEGVVMDYIRVHLDMSPTVNGIEAEFMVNIFDTAGEPMDSSGWYNFPFRPATPGCQVQCNTLPYPMEDMTVVLVIKNWKVSNKPESGSESYTSSSESCSI